MAWSAKTYTFSPSTTIFSAQVNQNFDDLVDDINTAMPSGGIIIWSGSVASIPSGWYLCNGSNSTPDLRGKFIYGAGGAYAVGATGGAETHTLSEAEMPVHTHSVTDPGHTHNAKYYDNAESGSGRKEFNPSGSLTFSPATLSATTGISLGNAGSGSAHNNLPPYHALAFIMKS
jgi:microcystin-dependent protein